MLQDAEPQQVAEELVGAWKEPDLPSYFCNQTSKPTLTTSSCWFVCCPAGCEPEQVAEELVGRVTVRVNNTTQASNASFNCNAMCISSVLQGAEPEQVAEELVGARDAVGERLEGARDAAADLAGDIKHRAKEAKVRKQEDSLQRSSNCLWMV